MKNHSDIFGVYFYIYKVSFILASKQQKLPYVGNASLVFKKALITQLKRLN